MASPVPTAPRQSPKQPTDEGGAAGPPLDLDHFVKYDEAGVLIRISPSQVRGALVALLVAVSAIVSSVFVAARWLASADDLRSTQTSIEKHTSEVIGLAMKSNAELIKQAIDANREAISAARADLISRVETAEKHLDGRLSAIQDAIEKRK